MTKTTWQPPKTVFLFDMGGDPRGTEIVWCDTPDPDNEDRDVWEYKLVKKVKRAKN